MQLSAPKSLVTEHEEEDNFNDKGKLKNRYSSMGCHFLAIGVKRTAA